MTSDHKLKTGVLAHSLAAIRLAPEAGASTSAGLRTFADAAFASTCRRKC